MELPLISILVALIIFALLFWAIRAIVPQLGLPPIVTTILYVFLTIALVLYLLDLLGLIGGYSGHVRVG